MAQEKKQNSTDGSGLSFQELIFELQKYWANQECVIVQPYDMEMGAGTFHPTHRFRKQPPGPDSSLGSNTIQRLGTEGDHERNEEYHVLMHHTVG